MSVAVGDSSTKARAPTLNNELPDKTGGNRTSTDGLEEKLERFSCHICLEVPDEPVVTPCGHLHCWPCMHEWLVTSRGRACPVCKATLTVEQLVPIYTSAAAVDPRSRPIPPRPRPAAPPPSAPFFRTPPFRNPFAALDPADEIAAATTTTASTGLTFQAGLFPLPGLALGWSWPPPLPPQHVVAENALGEGPGARVQVMRVPTREERVKAVVQQVFLALFFAMFVAITFGG
ncbi:hypothetical protein JCM8202_003165 [Rhodotorula sphaerocarpa]